MEKCTLIVLSCHYLRCEWSDLWRMTSANSGQDGVAVGFGKFK
jgi:hypothetical protein